MDLILTKLVTLIHIIKIYFYLSATVMFWCFFFIF